MDETLPRFPLFIYPFAYVRRTVSEFDPVHFASSKERHRLTIHERELGEIDGDWSLLPSDRVSERIKDVFVNPAAQAQYCNLLDVAVKPSSMFTSLHLICSSHNSMDPENAADHLL